MFDSLQFLTELNAHIAPNMARVDTEIKAALRSDVHLVEQVAHYIVGSGGKRMRPAITLLSAQCCTRDAPVCDTTILIAGIVELIHTATLLHDDVVDESSLRRGNATANANFGNAASVLVGDFLYSRSFQMMVRTGRMRVLEVLAEATNVIAEGEVHQLMNAGDVSLTEAQYLEVIRAKTAKLFEAAGRLGAIVTDAPHAQEEALARYGMYLGTAFQIADDVLDYEGDTTSIGKNLGDDLAEGKLTLPIIHALQRGSATQRATLIEIIQAHSHDALPERLHTVVDILHEAGSIDYARTVAQGEARRAAAQLAELPESKAKTLLLNSCFFAVSRRS